jgi:hypothetical protein
MPSAPEARSSALEQRLGRQGFSPEQVSAAYTAAVKAQQDSLGTYVNDNMKTVLMLMGLTQSASAALNEMPVAARAASVMSGLGRDGSGELNAVLRSAELRGLLMKEGSGEPDIAKLNQFIRAAEDITAMSGGRYGATDLLQFQIAGKASAAMLRGASYNADGSVKDVGSIPGMLAVIQAVGASQAGTGLVGFSQQFSTGKMSDGTFKFLTESGIIKHPELAQKVGIGYHQLLPGSMGTDDLEMARGDPAQFITQRVLPGVRSYLSQHYGDKYNRGSEEQREQYEQATIAGWGSRITGGGFMAEIVRLIPLMLRDERAALLQAKKGDPYDDVVKNNPNMLMAGMDADANAAMVQFGKTNMTTIVDFIKAATTALTALNNAMIAHPALAQEIFAIAAALAVLGTVVGAVMPVIIAINAAKGVKGYLFRGAAAAAEGAGLEAGAAGAAGSAAGAGFLPAALIAGGAWFAKKALDSVTISVADVMNKVGFHEAAMLEAMSGGLSPEDAAKRYGLTVGKNGDLHVTVQMGADKVGQAMVKGVVGQLSGPQTGRGDFDPKRSRTNTEN